MFLLNICYIINSQLFVYSDIFAQSNLQIIKYRNLDLDLGNGTYTNAQITYPAIGKGPFPGILLIPGSGLADKNETTGAEYKNGAKPATPLWQIAKYLSERGFEVLRYDKRGVGDNYTILNKNVWGNVTANNLFEDSKRALDILIQQPDVDPTRITIIGHSEGTLYAPRVAINAPSQVKNIVLMGTLAQNPILDLYYHQIVSGPIEYARQTIDKNNSGEITIHEISTDSLLSNILVPHNILNTKNMN